MLNLAINVNGAVYNNVQFSIAGRLTFMDVWKPASEVRVDLAVGSEYRLAGEYYVPLVKGKRWFVAPQGGISSVPFPVYSGTERVADYRLDAFSAGFDLGYAINRFSEVRVGYDAAHLILSRQVGNPQLPDLDGRRSGARALYVVDKLDDPVVPQQGYAGFATTKWFDSNPGTVDPFTNAQLEFRLFHRPRGSTLNSIFFTASGGTTFGGNDGGLPVFSLGGPLRLSAYGTNELLTNQYFLFQIGLTHQLGVDSLVGNRYYAFGIYEIGKAYGVPGQSALPNDIALGVIAKTIFGPLMLGGSYGDNGHGKVFFRIGRLF
jgi:NTE family protein